MSVESFLYGVIAASAIMFIYHKICDLGSYLNFRRWCDDRDITEEDLKDKNITKYYTMWRLSQLEGVEIVEHKGDR